MLGEPAARRVRDRRHLGARGISRPGTAAPLAERRERLAHQHRARAVGDRVGAAEMIDERIDRVVRTVAAAAVDRDRATIGLHLMAPGRDPARAVADDLEQSSGVVARLGAVRVGGDLPPVLIVRAVVERTRIGAVADRPRLVRRRPGDRRAVLGLEVAVGVVTVGISARGRDRMDSSRPIGIAADIALGGDVAGRVVGKIEVGRAVERAVVEAVQVVVVERLGQRLNRIIAGLEIPDPIPGEGRTKLSYALSHINDGFDATPRCVRATSSSRP